MMSRRHQVLARIGAAAAALTLACSEPEQPAAVTVSPATVTMDAVGDTKQLTAKATDKEGLELTGVIFTWASSAAGVASVDSAGKVTSVGAGTSDVTATAGGVSGTAKVTVAQVISTVEATSGAQQTGTVGQALPQQLVVRVRDRLDNAVPGAAVTLTVQANGGTVAPSSGTTGADGQLSATWTLGTTAGNFQVTVTVTASGQSAVFNAKANPGPANNLTKVSGDNQFGFQGTKLAQLAVVRVRDQYGNGVPSHAVQFSTSTGNGTVDSSIAFTDTSGMARSGWVMPSTVGSVALQVAALSGAGSPLLGSPVTFNATSHNVRVTGWSPTTLNEGQGATLTGSGFDAGNTQNLVTIDGVAATVTAATASDLTVTVPVYDCKPARNVAVQVTVAGTPAAPVTMPLNPALAPLNLSVGQQTIVTDPTQFCFQFAAAAAQESYLIGVQSTAEVATLLTPISLVGTAAGAATAPPALSAPARAPQRPTISPLSAERLERWQRYRAAEVRQRAFDAEIFQQLRATAGRRAPPAAPAAIVPDTAKVGDTLQVRVVSGGGRAHFTHNHPVVRAQGTNAFFLEDVANPGGGYAPSQVTAFSQQYDAKTHPTNAAEFGTPTDRDANGRIVVVVTKEVNKRGSGGFTTSCDLGARTTYPGSNEGEFFYILAPDPSGTFHPQRRPYSLQAATLELPDIVAHESVHVIQFGRRQAAGAAQFLDIWAAEGQAVLGEEVVGHAVEGRQTGQNYGFGIVANLDDTTSTDWYFGAFAALGFYFGWDPITNSSNPNGRAANAPWECTWLDDDYGGPCVAGLEVYGPPWSLFRYLNDRFGPTYTGGEAGIQKAIIEHPQTGFGMLQSVTGLRVDSLLAQWAAMLYVDDLTDNWTSLAPTLSLASWNLDDVFYGTYTLGQFVYSMYTSSRLTPVNLTYASFSNSATVRAASTFYAVITGATRSATAVKARDASGTGILPSTMRYWIVRVQ